MNNPPLKHRLKYKGPYQISIRRARGKNLLLKLLLEAKKYIESLIANNY